MRMIFNATNLRQAKSASPEILAERLQTFEKSLWNHHLKSRPYRTFSTEWGQKKGNDPKLKYAQMAEYGGAR